MTRKVNRQATMGGDERTTTGLDCRAEDAQPFSCYCELHEPQHAKPGQYCPECEDFHCVNDDVGHTYNDDDICIYCGADGRA